MSTHGEGMAERVKVGAEQRDAVGGYMAAGAASARSALLILVAIGLCLMVMLAASVNRSVERTIDAGVTNALDGNAVKVPGTRR